MNLMVIFKIVGRVLMIEAAAMLPSLLVALIYNEDLKPFILSIAIVLIVGGILSALPARKGFYSREGFVAVGLIWLLTGLVGALPFWFSGCFASLADCIFESCSGFTTTGASVLTDIEALPHGILFWRSFTHWLGGMGVLVLATALLPLMGVRSHYLTQAESPGPVFAKLVPRQSQTSKILYAIYCSLTLLQIVLLRLAGMPLYDSFIHAFGTAGTGGFSNRNASIGAYDSVAIEMIISVFILLFSINFAIHFLILTRRFREVRQSDELRFFLTVVTGATVLIAVSIYPVYSSAAQALRQAFFQVCSIISTTGYCSVDWSLWPQFAQMVLVMLMFCGACAGSTGGGIKCSRVLILLRTLRREIHRIAHPRAVEVIKLDGKVVNEDTVRSIMIFLGSYMLIILMGTLLISLDNFSFTVSFTSALTCVSNVGPGLEMVGPVGNFSAFSAFSKLVMSLCMIIGRLEILPVLMLCSRVTWRRN